MRAAGVVEFTLAFSLLWTSLVRRSAAIMLAGMFICATFEFGKIDIIGRPIVVILVAIIADNKAAVQQPSRRLAFAAPFGYGFALGFLALYYGIHAALFGTRVL